MADVAGPYAVSEYYHRFVFPPTPLEGSHVRSSELLGRPSPRGLAFLYPETAGPASRHCMREVEGQA